MVERERPALPVPLQHQPCQVFVLFQHNRQVFLCQGSGITFRADNRFHAQLGKAQVEHDFDVLQEIRVRMGKGAPHVVVLPAPGLHQFLELRHNFLPASVAGIIHTAAVMDFLAPVQAQHDIAHFPVGEINHVIINQYTVGRQRKPEMLALFLLDAPGIGCQLLYHVEVHQRFPAEEIHLQVAAAAGICYQEIQRLFADLIGHHGALPVVLALAGKTVCTVQVAGMRHMQAQCLHHSGGPLFQRACHRFKHIR